MKYLNKIIFVIVILLTLFITSCKKCSLSLDVENITLKVGETYIINPITNVENPVFNYSISDNTIVKIENNQIQALKQGVCEITISIVESKAKPVTLTVTVNEAPKPIKIVSDTPLELIIGSTYQVEYHIEPFDASQEVTFTSADKSVVEIDENGLITCIALGETFITIKSKDNSNLKLRVFLEVVLPDVEKIECVDELTLGYYETKQLTALVSPSTAVQEVTYKSLDENIVTVDDEGNVTSIKPGTTKIIVTSVYDQSVTHEVLVTVSGTKATSLTASDNINLELGKSIYINYNISPSDAFRKVEYIVSDKSAIEVYDGMLIAKKNGTYTLTLKTIDGSNLEKVINVNITGESTPVLSLAESFEKDTNISLYEPFDPLEGLRVFDAEDGELTKSLKVTNPVNINEYGKYKVIYEVKDSDGNNLYYERNIEVVWDYSVTFIGHAGSLYGAMNSEEAILYAAKVLKYTAIEIDLKQTKDGVFVLSHDETFAGYELGKYDWEFLKDVTVTSKRSPGISNPSPESSYTAKLCTLTRYLEICRQYNITAVIELKTSAGISNWTETNAPQTSRMPALIDQIKSCGMIENVIFLTSQYECLAWTRKNGYEFIPCQYLVSSCESQSILDRCIQNNFDVSFNARDGVKNSVEWIQKYKDAGLKVSTYTFEQWASYDDVQEWIDLGVDFITTDWHNPKLLNLTK